MKGLNMKKIIALTMLSALLIGNSLINSTAQAKTTPSVQMLPAFSSVTKSENRLWVGTFQIVWNDFMNEVVKGPIKFQNGNPKNADLLNNQEFKKSMISQDSYYSAWGRTNLALKAKIEKALMAKFGEKSALLDKIDWNDPYNAYLFYAMLKKDFKYNVKFENLKNEKFGNGKEQIPYFGLSKLSPSYLYNGVDVLFYNSPFDYAVTLKSPKDKVILYRTITNKPFAKSYNDLQAKAKNYKGDKKFIAGDELKVPAMTIKQDVKYTELCGKPILSTNLYIDNALQTVEFNMNRRGVKLKSEAVIDANFMSMPIEIKKNGRKFYFNNTFVMFMQENDKEMPYFALRVKDMDLYKYTGKID